MYECVWKFETAEWCVSLEVAPCEDYPDWHDTQAESEEWQRDIDAGRLVYFNACVQAYHKPSGVYGSNSLGACEYRDFEDFYASHRDQDPMNRNCSIMRAAKGDNVVMCHYFPDMVRLAVEDARNAMAHARNAKLRA